MSDKIYGINDIIAKTGNIKPKKAEKIGSDVFSKILDTAVSNAGTQKTDSVKATHEIFQPTYINPLSKIENNTEASKYVVENIDNILKDLELFSNLMGDSSVELDDISPLAGRIKESVNSILRYSEKNNIPNELKSMVKESSAIAYAAAEKLNTFI